MKEQQNRILMQWLVPAGCMAFIIILMFFNFFTQIKREGITGTQKDITAAAKAHAVSVNRELELVEAAGRTAATMLAGETITPVRVQTAAEALLAAAPVYGVIYDDGKGSGYGQDGTAISLSDFSYYEDLKLQEDVTCYFLPDDEQKEHRAAILFAIRLQGDPRAAGSRLLLYYPMERMEELLAVTPELDSESFEALIDTEGNLLYRGEEKSGFLEGDNLFETLTETYRSSISKTCAQIENGSTSSFEAIVEGEERTLVFSPLKINGWTVVLGVRQSCVERMQDKGWKVTSSMLFQTLVVIFVFLAAVLIINIISRRKIAERDRILWEKADTDQLTGLNNKLATERRIREYIEENPNSTALMFVLDIDNFKKINDTMGHAFGDEVLRCLGKRIGSVFRVTDIIGRTGGDEFTIFLKFLKNDVNTEKEAQKLLNFFQDFVAGEYVKYSVTASIGAAVYPANGADFETLYKAADKALYKAKKRGKNQLAFYDDRDQKK